jgi:phage terminase large subunit
MRLMDKYTVDFVYIDSANQQMKYDFAVEHDIYSINARKDVNLGIGYCQGLVQNGYITIDPSCTKVIEMLNNYSWDGREGILNEKPLHNRYSHMADAFRYAIYSSSYSFNPISDE